MKHSLIYLILIFLLACQEKSNFENISVLQIDLDTSKNGKFSDLFDDIEYILLVTPEDFPLVEPHNIKFSDKRIFVRDWATNQLFIFDEKGRFERVIKAMGKGPGEYFQMNDFQIKGESIYILDFFLNKIIQFDFSGSFIQEIRHDLDNNNFYLGSEYKLFFNSYNIDHGRFNFLRENEEGLKGFVSFEKDKENIVNFNSHTGFIEDPHNPFIYFNIPYSTEVAVFNKKNGNLSRIIQFDFGKHNTETRVLKERSTTIQEIQSQRNLVVDLAAFFPFKNHYITIVKQGAAKMHYLLLDQTFQKIGQFQHLENDLDQMKFEGYPWTFSENELVYSISTTSFYNDYVNTFSGKNVQVSSNNVHGFFDKSKEKLMDDSHMLIKLRVNNSFPN
ncbi:hypothetical protein P872_22800 [Rhodonellum psychrophilum GCM71 = DSM 17998]|uniref:6-bladed beta-propeller n=2 Tax=Rhodonellum TaxID=336827 RepID=U5C4E8_9BACT|nr:MULTISPECIES: 6-bladed beta-propeller [Rhodonellum]ERM84893.1 hypothetical protein P872_22800 [Rhodonellum psychrophilum GCM71 = DSM 17998]SDY72963.1 6-bladed beta-propeller protein [Rhodonellum ikkaensis]